MFFMQHENSKLLFSRMSTLTLPSLRLLLFSRSLIIPIFYFITSFGPIEIKFAKVTSGVMDSGLVSSWNIVYTGILYSKLVNEKKNHIRGVINYVV